MHDIDRALFEAEAETEAETEAYGDAYGETHESYGQTFEEEEQEEEEYQPPGPGGLGQSREHILAAELLDVTSEAGMDHFLGKVLSSAVSAVRDFARSDTGRAVGGVLKSAAAQALPQFGQIAGDALRPAGAARTAGGRAAGAAGAAGAGRTAGGRAGGAAGGRPGATSGRPGATSGRASATGQRAGAGTAGKREVGLQTEGLSAEDHEYQTARAFVRFADETAQRAVEMAGAAPPAVVAQEAATAAARQHLPGLLRAPGAAGPAAPSTGASEGRWIRRGNRIVVLGA